MRKNSIYSLYALLTCLLLGGSALAVGEYLDYREEMAIAAVVMNISSKIPPPQNRDIHYRTDRTRAFLQKHTVHSLNAEFRRLWREPAAHFARVLKGIEDPETGPAPMECSTRADLMRRLLRQEGLRTRLVDVYSPQNGFQSHTFLEVFNPLAKKWEIADPDLNIFWKDLRNGGRAGIRDLVARPVSQFVPCSAPGRCGWQVHHNPDTNPPREMRRENYYSLARIKDPDQGPFVLFNSRRFDLETRHDGAAYCQSHGKICEIGLTDLAEKS